MAFDEAGRSFAKRAWIDAGINLANGTLSKLHCRRLRYASKEMIKLSLEASQ